MFTRYDSKTMTAFDDERGLALQTGGGRMDLKQTRFNLVHKDWEFVETTYYEERGIERTFSEEKNEEGFLDKTVEIADGSRIVMQLSNCKPVRGNRPWSEEIRKLFKEGLYYIFEYSLGQDEAGNSNIDKVNVHFAQAFDDRKILPPPYLPPHKINIAI